MDESVGGTAEPQLERMSKARIGRVTATSATKSRSDFYHAWNERSVAFRSQLTHRWSWFGCARTAELSGLLLDYCLHRVFTPR
jgi:hypothetical protein